MEPPYLFNQGTVNGYKNNFNIYCIGKRFIIHLLHYIFVVNTDKIGDEGSYIELDSLEEYPVVLIHANIIQHTGKRVAVSGFTDYIVTLIMLNVVHSANAYDCEYSGDTYAVII